MVFESNPFTLDPSEAIKLGWLVDPIEERVLIDGIDFEHVPIVFNEFGEPDFSLPALEMLMKEEGPLWAVAKPTLAKSDGRSVLIFTSGVAHAHLLAGILNREKPGSAAAIDGKTTPPGHPERQRIMDDFRKGKIQYLCNFGICTEGTDIPSCDMVVIARPTKSILILMQMVGRGLRPLPGVVDGHILSVVRRAAIAESGKPSCLVLYFSPKTANVKTATTFDALGGSYEEEVVELAKELDEETPGTSKVNERLEEAAILAPVLAQNKLRKKLKAEVEWRTETVGSHQESANPDVTNIRRGGANDGQIERLLDLGVTYETAAGYTSKQAWIVIEKKRAERCTNKQRKTLARFGEDPNVNFAKAKEIIDAIAKNGWKPLNETSRKNSA
jgi:superfamily II DNA or RNA helicase